MKLLKHFGLFFLATVAEEVPDDVIHSDGVPVNETDLPLVPRSGNRIHLI